MDIPRPKRKKTFRNVLVAAGLAVAAAGTAALTRLEPAAPSVERATLWIDTVRRGAFVRQVRAPGTLVPEHVRLISALTQGRVEQILVRPGAAVEAGTVLFTLSNPDVQLQLLEAERQLGAAQATLVSLKSQLETARLAQQATVAGLQNDYAEARRNADVYEALGKKGLASVNEMQNARDRASSLSLRRDIEQRRLALAGSTIGQQLALEEANVERMRAVAQFQRERLASMQVTAGEAGVLQSEDLDYGQWVLPGQVLARVAQPGRLKAVLRVPETQAKDVAVGQVVAVDTRTGSGAADGQRAGAAVATGGTTGVIPGRVMRVDPAVQNGTVAVEVALEPAGGVLPPGVRADLSVDGTVEIERLSDVLSVGRPAYGQPESTVGLFRLSPDGTAARRVRVTLGRASVNAVEVLRGLNPGDRVIISDVSQYDAQDRLRIR
ncbi:RND transporter [Gemmatimonadetes bacterium T265]|nr:RND transporter [Gemmatimonadetes bacterium T265]